VTLHQAGSLDDVDALLSPAGDGGIIRERFRRGLSQLESAPQDGSSFLTGNGLVGLEGTVVITLQNVILDTEVNGSLAPEVCSNIGEHGGSFLGVGIVTQGVGNHGSELRTSGSASGIEGAVAHTGNISINSHGGKAVRGEGSKPGFSFHKRVKSC